MAASDPLGADLGASLLLTDLYQLDMLQAYRDAGMAIAVCEFFVRRLPPTRGFLVAAGLEQVVINLLPRKGLRRFACDPAGAHHPAQGAGGGA